MILKSTYFPMHQENRMANEGDVEMARERFFRERPTALSFLLHQRYSWMKKYLVGRETVVEFGAGAGFSKEFLDCPNLLLTDVVKRPWIDMAADALNPPFEDESIDIIICSHMIHHLASPIHFFNVMRSKLRPGGILLIQDLHTSLMLRAMLRIMRHEGWSYDNDVFDKNSIANDPADPWSANCAIPELLFRNEQAFARQITGFRFLYNQLNECFIFPLSGGVIAKTKTIQFPSCVYEVVKKIDRFLVRMLPDIFSLGRSVALEKIN